MKDLVDTKIILKNDISCLGVVPLAVAVTLEKVTPKKTLFTLPKNEWTRKTWITALNQKRALLCKVSTLTSSKLSAEYCSNIIVLLFTAKTQDSSLI